MVNCGRKFKCRRFWIILERNGLDELTINNSLSPPAKINTSTKKIWQKYSILTHKMRGHDTISFDTLSEGFRRQLFKDELENVRVSSHCKLTTALYFRRNVKQAGQFEIGVSKHWCWLCQNYLEILLRKKKLHIQVSGNQGKIHVGWDMPPDTPKSRISKKDK